MFSPSRLAKHLAEIEASEPRGMDPAIATALRSLAAAGLQRVRLSIGRQSEWTLSLWAVSDAYPEAAQLAGLELARRAELEA